jgi:SOS-response transcriptional repressor LexA
MFRTGSAGVSKSMVAQYRRSPSMVSTKLQVLDFAKAYFLRWGRSPSYGEIGNALGINRYRARDVVRVLTAEGEIRREPGDRRGMTFPGLEQQVSEGDAILALRAAGWTVNPDGMAFERADPTTFPPLPRVPDLEQIPVIDVGGQQNVGQQSSRGEGDARDHRAAPQTGPR